MKKYTNIAAYFADQKQWEEELQQLRSILLESELKEAFKWNFPVYMLDNKNLIGLGTTKTHCCLWFFQGVFLTDRAGLLLNAQEGKTKAMRQWRFSSSEGIDEKLICAYIEESIQNQRDGLEMKPERRKKRNIEIPAELQSALAADVELKNLFEQFSPGNQADFAEYIGTAKREATRASRMEKVAVMIRAGEGLNDKYRK